MAAGKKMLLTPAELADMTGFGTQTLANWRSEGKGPGYKKIGRMIRYPVADVEEWLETYPTIKRS